MKNKLLSIVLTASMSVTVICAGTGGAYAASESRAVISIDVDPDTFTNVTKMCCYIYDQTDSAEIVKWGSKKGVMTKDGASGMWSCDLGERGAELDPSHEYSVIFTNDWGKAQTEQLTITGFDSAREYTAVFSDIYTWHSYDSTPVFKYKWLGENDDKAGVDVIRVRADDDAFGAGRAVYCEAYDETNGESVLWNGRMKRDEDADTWSFDFGAHGIELVTGHKYSVKFSDSDALTIDSYDSSKDYTAEFTGAFIADEIGEAHPRMKWTDEQADEPFTYTTGSLLLIRGLNDGETKTVTVTAAENTEVRLTTGDQSDFDDSAFLSVTAYDSAGKRVANLSKKREHNHDITESNLFLTKSGETYTIEITASGISGLELYFTDIFEYELGMVCSNDSEDEFCGDTVYYRFIPDCDGTLSAELTDLRIGEDSAYPEFLISRSPDFSDASQLPCDVKKGETYYIKASFINCGGSYSFELAAKPVISPGDADGNGAANISDVTAMQRHIAEFELLTGNLLIAADINGNGKVDISDATYLQMYLAQMIEDLG